MKSFSEKIKYVMGVKNISQGEIVEKLKTDKSTVSLWVSGKRRPRPKTIRELSKFLGCSEIWLSSGEGYPFKEDSKLSELNTFQVSEPERIKSYQENKIFKYERLLHKFEYIFDFLIEWHGDDSREIDLFLERMKKDFLTHDPNYRQWTYDRDEKAKERLKNMVGEDNQDRTPDNKSANDS